MLVSRIYAREANKCDWVAISRKKTDRETRECFLSSLKDMCGCLLFSLLLLFLWLFFVFISLLYFVRMIHCACFYFLWLNIYRYVRISESQFKQCERVNGCINVSFTPTHSVKYIYAYVRTIQVCASFSSVLIFFVSRLIETLSLNDYDTFDYRIAYIRQANNRYNVNKCHFSVMMNDLIIEQVQLPSHSTIVNNIQKLILVPWIDNFQHTKNKHIRLTEMWNDVLRWLQSGKMAKLM